MAVFSPISGGPLGTGSLPVLDALSIGTDARAIYAATSLVDWWTADTGVVGTGAGFYWIGRKNHRRLIPRTGDGDADAPGVVASAYAGKACLQAGTTSATIGELIDNSENLFPVASSFSVAYVARRGSADAYLFGSNGTTAFHIQHRAADDKVSVSHNGVSQGVTSTIAPYTTAPHIGIWSYDYVGKEGRFRMNRAAGLTKTSVVDENDDTRFQVLARGDTNAVNSGGAQVFEVMLFNSALHLNATLLANVETYYNARYGL